MEKDNLASLIETVKSESLDNDEHIMFNLSFGSLSQFMTFTDYINAVFAEVEAWKSRHKRIGPCLMEKSPSSQVSAVVFYTESYIEGFAMDMRSIEHDGVAFLKYTGPDAEKASKVLAMLAGNKRLAKAVQSAQYQKCKKPESVDIKAVKAHFAQTKDEATPDKSRVMPISEAVIGWFNGRGWALYEYSFETEGRQDLMVENGPASELRMGINYHVLPKIEDSSNPGAMEPAVRKMLARGRAPFYNDMNGKRFEVNAIQFTSDEALLYSCDGRGRMHVPYFNLKRTITSVITAHEL